MEIAAFIISAVSLALAIVSSVISLKTQKLQNKVNEIELKLKEYELAEKEKSSCVEARIVHSLKSNYKIKIWNSGNTAAKNVSVSWTPENGLIVFDRGKMPFEVLDPQKSFELSATAYDGCPSKLCIKTEWEDERGEMKEKVQWCDI